MLVGIKNVFTSKSALASMLLMTIWLFNDGIDRFTSNSINNNSEAEFTEIKSLKLPQLSEGELAQINAAYAKYDNPASKDDLQQSMSEAEQAKQQGVLNSLFIGDNQLTLKAVIQSEAKGLVALIEIKNIKSGVTKVERIINNHTVHGYSLVIEKNTQVRLTKQQAKTLQQIILTMYTSKA